MRLADLGEVNPAVLSNDKCRRIGRFVFRLPAQSVGKREMKSGIKHEVEVARRGFSTNEFFGTLFQSVGWPRIDEHDVGIRGFELLCIGQEVTYLNIAYGALVSRKSS